MKNGPLIERNHTSMYGRALYSAFRDDVWNGAYKIELAPNVRRLASFNSGEAWEKYLGGKGGPRDRSVDGVRKHFLDLGYGAAHIQFAENQQHYTDDAGYVMIFDLSDTRVIVPDAHGKPEKKAKADAS
jgi:hypothetical protein